MDSIAIPASFDILRSFSVPATDPEGADEEKAALNVNAPPIKVMIHLRGNEKFCRMMVRDPTSHVLV